MLGEEITLTVKAKLIRNKDGGSMYMAVSDCIAYVSNSETNEQLGKVGGVFGAGYELSTGDNSWYISPEIFWRALNEALENTNEQKKDE